MAIVFVVEERGFEVFDDHGCFVGWFWSWCRGFVALWTLTVEDSVVEKFCLREREAGAGFYTYVPVGMTVCGVIEISAR